MAEMPNIDALLNEWEKDSPIDELDIAGSIRDVPKLHSKYIRHLTNAKLHLRTLASRYQKLRKIKFRYYRGELTKEELTKLNWPQWQGIKPLKNEMEEFLKGDVELIAVEEMIVNTESIISTLEQIIKSINSRGYDVRTLLEAKKFYNGIN